MEYLRAVIFMVLGLFAALAAERLDSINRAMYRGTPRWVRAVYEWQIVHPVVVFRIVGVVFVVAGFGMLVGALVG